MTARVSVDVELFLLGAAQHRQLDIGVDVAAHLVDGLVQGHALHVLAVDGGDEVAGQDAGARGRGVVDRRHDLDQAVFLHDLDAEAAEGAARLHLHVV